MMRGGGAAESKRNRVVLVAFRPKRYNTMDYMGCGEMLRSCGKFLGGGAESETLAPTLPDNATNYSTMAYFNALWVSSTCRKDNFPS